MTTVYVLLLTFFFHPLPGNTIGMVQTQGVVAYSMEDCQMAKPLIINDYKLKKFVEGSIDDLQGTCIKITKQVI